MVSVARAIGHALFALLSLYLSPFVLTFYALSRLDRLRSARRISSRRRQALRNEGGIIKKSR
jgi:hypothetical protein